MAETQVSLPQFCTMLMRQLQMAEHPTPVQMQILDYLENGLNEESFAPFEGVASPHSQPCMCCGSSTRSRIRRC